MGNLCSDQHVGKIAPMMAADPREESANKTIQERLKTSDDDELAVHRVLLLGPGDSGKTTIIKQMKKIHSHLDEKTKTSITSYLRKKIIENTQILSSFCHFDNEIYERAREQILDFDWAKKLEHEDESTLNDFELRATIESIKLLWNDKSFREILDWRGHRNAFQIDCNTHYFMQRIDKIFDINYIPTDDEYFRFRMRTTGISEEKMVAETDILGKKSKKKEKRTFYFIDVGGQRSERKKWMNMVTDQIKSVLYICAISEFDMTLYEDAQVNRLQESFDLFKTVRDYGNDRQMKSFLDSKTLVIFLNKYDLFLYKVARHGIEFANNFDDFEDFYFEQRGFNFINYYQTKDNLNNLNEYKEIDYHNSRIPEFDNLDMNKIYKRYLPQTFYEEMLKEMAYSNNKNNINNINNNEISQTTSNANNNIERDKRDSNVGIIGNDILSNERKESITVNKQDENGMINNNNNSNNKVNFVENSYDESRTNTATVTGNIARSNSTRDAILSHSKNSKILSQTDTNNANIDNNNINNNGDPNNTNNISNNNTNKNNNNNGNEAVSRIEIGRSDSNDSSNEIDNDESRTSLIATTSPNTIDRVNTLNSMNNGIHGLSGLHGMNDMTDVKDEKYWNEDEKKYNDLHKTILEYVRDTFETYYHDKYVKHPKIHFEVTCALDTKQMEKLMHNVIQDIVTQSLLESGFLS